MVGGTGVLTLPAQADVCGWILQKAHRKPEI